MLAVGNGRKKGNLRCFTAQGKSFAFFPKIRWAAANYYSDRRFFPIVGKQNRKSFTFGYKRSHEE